MPPSKLTRVRTNPRRFPVSKFYMDANSLVKLPVESALTNTVNRLRQRHDRPKGQEQRQLDALLSATKPETLYPIHTKNLKLLRLNEFVYPHLTVNSYSPGGSLAGGNELTDDVRRRHAAIGEVSLQVVDAGVQELSFIVVLLVQSNL